MNTLTPSSIAVVILLCAAGIVRAETPPAKPRLAETPPMGWNSWEAFRRDFDEDVIKAEVDAMVASGLRDAGYSYFVIDGGWKPASRDAEGNLICDPKKFPHGMKAIADYVHARGLKFGLHQPAGMHDCPKLSPGSQGHEEADAAVLASWDVDFVKYDQCDYVHPPNATTGAPDFDRFVLRQDKNTVFSTEAEAVQNHLTGLARVEHRAGCSGGRVVSAIGYDKGALIIPDLTAPAAGRYSLDVYFFYPFFGWNMDQFKTVTFFVAVNDAPAPQRVEVPFNRDQRYTSGMVTVEVELKQGVNRITLDNPLSKEENVRQSYVKMANALNGTGRPIVFSISGAARPWLWAEPIAHLYRCEADIVDRWSGGTGSTITAVVDHHLHLLDYAAVEFWPDPDMLEVGRKGRVDRPERRKPAMSDAEYRAQFSLWCIMNAPLFISMDLREIEDATKKILLNRDVIAVNQDPLASPCRCVRSAGEVQIFVKPLSDGQAVAILNRGADATDVSLSAAELELAGKGGNWTGQNLWTGESVSLATTAPLTAHVESHAVAMFKVTKPK